jgi:hypothetical protein
VLENPFCLQLLFARRILEALVARIPFAPLQFSERNSERGAFQSLMEYDLFGLRPSLDWLHVKYIEFDGA